MVLAREGQRLWSWRPIVRCRVMEPDHKLDEVKGQAASAGHLVQQCAELRRALRSRQGTIRRRHGFAA